MKIEEKESVSFSKGDIVPKLDLSGTFYPSFTANPGMYSNLDADAIQGGVVID